VLDPEGLYWRYPGDETDDQERLRVIEQRLDVPLRNVEVARLMMERDGWQLSEAPDGSEDDLHRLYFRKVTALTSEAKRNFLTAALQVAHDADGTLMSWINVEDHEDN
jgi:hypothetical protein